MAVFSQIGISTLNSFKTNIVTTDIFNCSTIGYECLEWNQVVYYQGITLGVKSRLLGYPVLIIFLPYWLSVECQFYDSSNLPFSWVARILWLPSGQREISKSLMWDFVARLVLRSRSNWMKPRLILLCSSQWLGRLFLSKSSHNFSGLEVTLRWYTFMIEEED